MTQNEDEDWHALQEFSQNPALFSLTLEDLQTEIAARVPGCLISYISPGNHAEPMVHTLYCGDVVECVESIEDALDRIMDDEFGWEPEDYEDVE